MASADVYHVSDRGHKHSDGHSEITFIISKGKPRVSLLAEAHPSRVPQGQLNPNADEFTPTDAVDPSTSPSENAKAKKTVTFTSVSIPRSYLCERTSGRAVRVATNDYTF